MPERERTFRLEAVVLRHQDFGEADRLLTLYSHQRGKLRAIAKGVRKLHSRKAGHLGPFSQVMLLLARGRELPIITQAETIDSYQPLKENLTLVGYASYVVELIDRFTTEEERNHRLFRLLTDTLARLSKQGNTTLVLRYYEIKLLDLVGFRPQLLTCVDCHKEIQAEDQYFSSELGGVLCPLCGQKKPGAIPISMLALKYLRHLQRSNYAEARHASIPTYVNREMEAIMQYYLTYLLERKLNTPGFLRRVIQEGK